MDIKTDPTASIQSTEATEKPVLLIVDDSRLMRHTLKKMLSNDFNLVEAVDGEDGWEKLLAEPRIEAVFSDLSMPNLDGYGLLERIRKAAEARINTLPFIVITGKEGDDQSLLEEVRNHGANGFVSKPFKTDDIISKTRAFLTRPTETSTETPVEISDETVRLAAEEEARRIAEQAEAQRLAAEAEAQRLAEEAARQAAEEEARRIAEQAEAQRLAAEAEAQRLAEEAARQAAEEEARRIAEQAEAQRLAAEAEAQRLAEETARQAAEEEALRIAEQAEAEARRQAAVTEARRQVEEAAQKAAIEPAPFTLLERFGVRVALPFIHISHVVLDIPSDEQYATLRKRLKRK